MGLRRKKKRSRTRRRSVGASPGTLVHLGERRSDHVRIRVIDFSPERLREEDVSSVEACFPFRDTAGVTWINIDGLHNVDLIRRLGEHFHVHPLVLEDVLNTGQRSKVEDYGSYLFAVARTITQDSAAEEEQITLLVGPGFVISFQEREGDVFEPVRERIRNGRPRIRRLGSDYLAYCLIDTIVDHYLVVLETMIEDIDAFGDRIIADPQRYSIEEIHDLKSNIIQLRKSILPIRDVAASLLRSESSLIADETRPFLRDLHDHSLRVVESVEALRELSAGMLDLYLSGMSHRMNEVMKLLTLIATIFIPLTFVAGIYGMNFVHMPELHWRWGYPTVLISMGAVGVAMVVFFKRKGWL